MKSVFKRFSKLMKKGRIHKAVKAAGFRKRKKNGTNTNAANNCNV